LGGKFSTSIDYLQVDPVKKGGIYSDEKCPNCGGRFKAYEPHGMWCPECGPDFTPKSLIVRFGPQITRRYQDWQKAWEKLTWLRSEAARPSFDPLDHQIKAAPHGFIALSSEWLDEKTGEVGPSTMANYRNYMDRAQNFFGHATVRDITGRDIKRFLNAQTDLADKTRHEINSALKQFWKWLKFYDEHRPLIDRMPRFPVIRFELGTRTILPSKDLQLKILDEVRRQNRAAPRVWIACQWLCRYPALRPDDIRRVREMDVNPDTGLVVIERPTKRRKRKTIWLLDDDIDLIRNLTRGMPQMPLFRHERTRAGGSNGLVKAGDVFGKHYLWRRWKSACEALHVDGGSLYGHTRHTTTTALQSGFTPDQIRQMTQHDTNSAFERYLSPDRQKQLDMARLAAGQGEVVGMKKEQGR
jgi:hypothetical protein